MERYDFQDVERGFVWAGTGWIFRAWAKRGHGIPAKNIDILTMQYLKSWKT